MRELLDGAWNPPSTDLVRRVLDHVAHPIFVKDRSFRFVFLNHALCKMVGYPRDSMLGKTDYDFFPQAEADFFRAKDVELFSTGREIVIDEEQITDAHGRRHVLATTKVPLRGENGEITHVVGIIHDITRLKAAEDALRFANQELERRVEERSLALAAAQEDLHRKERLAVLGRLAGGVAHEIRNPLATIRSAGQILRRMVSFGEQTNAGETLDIIDEEIGRADRIIEDLIDYARVRPPARVAVPVGYLVEQALGGQFLPTGVCIVRELPDLPDVFVDPQQVQGALSNVLRNALEAVSDEGMLHVRTRCDGPEVVIRISDSGPGIPHDVRSRLFEPLFTTKARGLGLGLVTARSLLENQGGSIECIADAGGATFDVRLPVVPR
jgi:PAS domain S-box-containing protein